LVWENFDWIDLIMEGYSFELFAVTREFL